MKNAVNRIMENEFYILYKRELKPKDVSDKYVIYHTKEYGGDCFRSFKSLTQARKMFNICSKEAFDYEKTMRF